MGLPDLSASSPLGHECTCLAFSLHFLQIKLGKPHAEHPFSCGMVLHTTRKAGHDWRLLLQATLANAEIELEDADLDVADLPAPALPAAATTGGDVEKAKKKRKATTDEGPEASGSKGAPSSPQV